MHALRRTLKWILGIVGGIVAIVLLLVVAIVIQPQLIFNGKVIGWGLRYADKAGIHARWERGDFAVHWRALLKKEFAIDLGGLCVDKDAATADAMALHACFSRARLAATVDFSKLMPRVTELGVIQVADGDVSLLMPPASATKKKADEEEKPAQDGGFSLPSWLDKPRMGPVDVDVTSWSMVNRGDEASRMAGDLSLHGKALDSHPLVALRASVERGRTKRDRMAGKVAIDAENGQGFWRTEGWDLRADADASLPGAGKAGARLKLEPHYQPEASLKLAADVDYRQGRRDFRADFKGQFDPKELRLELAHAEGKHLADAVDWFGSENCVLSVARASAELNPSRIRLDCPMKVTVPVPPQKYARFKLPTRVGMRLTADLQSSAFIPDAKTRVSGPVTLDIDPILTPLFEGNGRVANHIDGKVGTFPEGWKVQTELSSRLVVPRFQKVVEELRETEWAVPAPMNVLKGSIELLAGGKFDLSKGLTSLKLPVTFRTRLGSPTERVNTDVSATVESSVQSVKAAQRTVKVNVNAVMSDVQLQLPRLELAAPPRFMPDNRFHPIRQQAGLAAPFAVGHSGSDEGVAGGTAGPNGLNSAGAPKAADAQTGAVRLDYDASITTPAETPLKILSNLTKAPVPIGLDLSMTPDSPMSGDVKIMNFDVELFRRQATVDHFTLSMAPVMSDSDVDGLIKVEYTDYTVYVHLSGTVGKTRVVLSSDPPLPESSLASVLLFGYPPEDLDQSQASSAGNASAALRAGAMGLASLYFLASTPIQSIGYDPSTGAVIAKVRLGEGTSLNLGQNEQERQTVGIRKRLSQSWALTGEVSDPNDPLLRQLSLYLEWARRY